MKLSLRLKVVAIFISIELLMVLAIGNFYTSKAVEMMKEEFMSRGRLIANYLAHSAQLGVLSGNIALLNELCDKTLRNEGVAAVRIADDKGRPLAVCSSSPQSADLVVVSAPILLEHGAFTDPEGVYSITGTGEMERLGKVDVHLTKQRLKARIDDLQRYVWWICITAMAISVVIGVILVNSMVVAPILRLRDATNRFARGDLDVRIPERGSDEISELARSFNAMARSLNGYISEQITTATDRLQLKNLAMLGELSARLMHEVGNALNRIGVIRYQLSQERLSSAGQKALENLESEMGSLKRFTRDVSLFSQRPEVRVSRVDLRSLVQGLCSSLSLMDKKSVEIFMDFSADEIPVMADRELINQAILNLLTNAYDAVDEGGHISVEVKAEESFITITVTDDGPGIAPDMQDQILKPFFTTKGPKGTGLGLSIAKSFVEAHGGDLTFESRPGYTRFTIRLPVRTI
jgi:signal transduction histidine kinase